MHLLASCLAALVLFLPQPAVAQARIPGSYLEGLRQAEAATASLPAAAFAPARDPALDKLVLQHSRALGQLGTARAFVGDTEGALAAFDLARRRQPHHPATVAGQMAQLENAAAEDAIAAIVREARTRRVVLINEAHHVPLHRAFAQRLAAELRKIGYSYLACETLNPMGAQAAGSGTSGLAADERPPPAEGDARRGAGRCGAHRYRFSVADCYALRAYIEV